jgi:hypothetical protein
MGAPLMAKKPDDQFSKKEAKARFIAAIKGAPSRQTRRA